MMEPLRNAAKVSFAIIVMASLVGQSFARPQPDEMEEMKKALYSTCVGKHPVTDEMKSNAKNGILSAERTFKCFIMCGFNELSLIDEEGVIDEDTMLSMAPDIIKESIEKASKACLPNIAGKPDACEVAYNFLSCGLKIDPKLDAMLPF